VSGLLIGVIVSHVIVLFDFSEEMHEKGEPLELAPRDAGIERISPVMITVGATILALETSLLRLDWWVLGRYPHHLALGPGLLLDLCARSKLDQMGDGWRQIGGRTARTQNESDPRLFFTLNSLHGPSLCLPCGTHRAIVGWRQDEKPQKSRRALRTQLVGNYIPRGHALLNASRIVLASAYLRRCRPALQSRHSQCAPPSPTVPATTFTGGINLHSGDIFQVQMSYSASTLTMTITDLTVPANTFTTSFPINIPATVGGNVASVGFTGGTGGQTATQEILNWTYSTP